MASGGIRPTGEWRPLDTGALADIRGQLGVYEIAEPDGTVLRIGAAGALEPFGLNSALADELERFGPGHVFRVHLTSAYRSRHLELLMIHLADHGRLPAANDEDPARLGRLSPG